MQAVAVAQSSPWIVSRRQDLVWFQGSVLAGVALLLLFRTLPPLGPGAGGAHPALWALLLWGVLFDGTHVFGTYARSYLAPTSASDEAARRGLPGARSWLVLALGPAVAIADHALCARGPSVMGQAGALFRFFLLGAYLWAYWHLVRQHYGFLALYRRKAGEPPRARVGLDAAVLWAGCVYPYVRFSLGPSYAASGLPVLLPPDAALALRFALDVAALAAAGALLVAGGAFIVMGTLEGSPIPPAQDSAGRSPAPSTRSAGRVRLGPKHLLLAIVIAFHAATFALLDNLLEITAVLTIFHNLQYHRIVWQHERGRGRAPAGGLGRYLGLGLALGVAWYGPRVLGAAAAPSDLLRNVLLGLGWGVAFHHYLVDARIWRVRRAPAVAKALDLGAAA
jgi:hypothetical protein